MNYYGYEALDEKGRKVKGEMEAENKDALRERVRSMGLDPRKIWIAMKPGATFYYVGTDTLGRHREGSVKADTVENAHAKLDKMGIRPKVVSLSKNLDTVSDDKPADSLAKGMSKPLLLVIFFATGVFMFSLPDTFMFLDWSDARSTVIEAKITLNEKSRIRYEYEVNGIQYAHGVRVPEHWGQTRSATLRVRYSLRHPMLAHPDELPLPRSPYVAPVAGGSVFALVLLLFFTSAFRYIKRIRTAWSNKKYVAYHDMERLIFNGIFCALFPLLYGCTFGVFMGSKESHFYSPYYSIFFGGTLVLAALIFYLVKKSPIYYD